MPFNYLNRSNIFENIEGSSAWKKKCSERELDTAHM